MIVVKLQAGFANQMLQYAAGKYLAQKNGTTLLLDRSWLDSEATNRVYELDSYKLEQTFINPGDYVVLRPSDTSFKKLLKRAYSVVSRKPLLHGYIQDPHHYTPYDKAFEKLGPNAYLEGYFMSQKFFPDMKQTLLKEFSYKNSPNQTNAKLLSSIKAGNAVSIHIRRGDYVADKKTSKYHGVLGLDYYQKAVKEVVKKVPKAVFYIISDDPVWCKENLKLEYPTVYVDHNTKGADDMRLMRACKHNIIANSTFSWWGAWLNENPDKIVVAPKQWFQGSSADVSDLIPKDWVRL